MTVEITQQDKLFSLSEAQELLAVIKNITRTHSQRLEPLQAKLDRMLSNDPRRALLEREYEQEVSVWQGKIERLGANAAGLWVVEFNVGDGALNWRYPELHIAYFRPEHATIRKKLTRYIEENDPDWAL